MNFSQHNSEYSVFVFYFYSMETNKRKSINIGLALSGGGARGIAHIGVIKALEEHDIQCNILAGTSVGAIVGALYAAGYGPEEMLGLFKQANIFRLFTFTIPDKGFTKLTYLKDQLARYIEEDSFEKLHKKLFIALTNLNTGQTEFRSSGPLFDVVTASSSIPLVFKPVEIDGHHYVDGGLMENLPASRGFLKASDVVIGVNAMPEIGLPDKQFSTVFSVATRCFELAVLGNSNSAIEKCNVLISPTKVHKYHIFQFNKYQELYDIGYEAGLQAIPALKEILAEKMVI